jgi:hypothetical protein
MGWKRAWWTSILVGVGAVIYWQSNYSGRVVSAAEEMDTSCRIHSSSGPGVDRVNINGVRLRMTAGQTWSALKKETKDHGASSEIHMEKSACSGGRSCVLSMSTTFDGLRYDVELTEGADPGCSVVKAVKIHRAAPLPRDQDEFAKIMTEALGEPKTIPAGKLWGDQDGAWFLVSDNAQDVELRDPTAEEAMRRERDQRQAGAAQAKAAAVAKVEEDKRLAAAASTRVEEERRASLEAVAKAKQDSSTPPARTESKDDGICPPCSRPEEEKLFRELTAVTQAAVVIITRRNTRNSTAPRIAIDIEVRGIGCGWVPQAATQLKAIGKLIAASPAALDLPHLQYSVAKLKINDERDFEILPSNRIIRILDLVETVKGNGPAVTLFAHGRLIAAGDATIERCLPKMLAGSEGESWERMYGAPDPRPEIMRTYQPVFMCIENARSEAERRACLSLSR